ncbi:MAG: hypothetical protein KDI73_02610 [Candidatus Competibacteraceae bacterium]|nr:hypothetical protein [Candidatus Competibacteraceae bacterium]
MKVYTDRPLNRRAAKTHGALTPCALEPYLCQRCWPNERRFASVVGPAASRLDAFRERL